MLKIDFHVHTWHSKDSNMSPEKLVKKVRDDDFSGIAITNHNTLEGYDEVRKLAKDLIVFRGEEIKTKEGEIIALEIKKAIPKGLDLIETCKLVKKQDGFIIVPHPFDILRKGLGPKSLKRVLKYADAIEGINSRSYSRRFNEKAIKFARENKKPMVAGSDSHFDFEIGYAYTLIDSKPDKKSILKAIRKGKTEIHGEKSGLRPHWHTFLMRFKF